MSQGREAIVKRGPGRPPRHSPYARLADSEFKFKTGDLVLVKWTDGMVYFAKIKRIDHKRQKCVVVFDDKSQDEAHFKQIHSVDETTTDIICIKCKKDDSDKPNEIVLCDMCGIGFHQKCHLPNIPASALELSTPWNCSYCQKGVKCPFLTESLDVLQNLLSDDEDDCSGAEDNTHDRATSSFDSERRYEPEVVDETPQVSPRKKRGRKPATESTVAMKRERRKVHQSHTVAPRHHHQSSSIVTMDYRSQPSEAWKAKPYNPSNEDGDSEPVYISSGKSTPEPSPVPPSAQVGIKRKRHHHATSSSSGGGGGGGHVKKQKRSSVESRTVSVTRVSVPVYDSSSAEEMDTSRDSSMCESSFSSGHGLGSIKEEGESGVHHEKRPRSLRVSLSIPDEVEPGTPFDKVMKVHHQRVSSPHHHQVETKELPSWENFENSNLLHRSSSSKQRPETLATKEKSDTLIPKTNTTVKPVPEASTVVISAAAAASKNVPSAFLASPLPISTSSSSKLGHPPATVTTPSAPGTDVKATTVGCSSSSSLSSTSLDVDDKSKASLSGGPSISPSPPAPPAPPPPPAAVGVGYSAPALGPDVVITTRPVVKSSQPEVKDLTPSSLPPQRSAPPPNQPQPRPTNLSNKPTSSSAITTPTATPPPPPPGITHPSTNSTISPTTKPAAFTTETSAPLSNTVGSGSGSASSAGGGARVAVPPSGQQKSVLVSGPRPQPVPTAAGAQVSPPPPKSTQHVLVSQRQPPTQKEQQQLSSATPQVLKTLPVQQVSSVPSVNTHQALAASVAQSPSTSRQQILVASTSRPFIGPIQQPVVVNNSQRPPSAPPTQQQQVLTRPPTNSVQSAAVNQPIALQQRQVYVASTRPASVPGQQHQPVMVTTVTTRPSSVPIQQPHLRPPSVPAQQKQQQQQTALAAPPRPASVPMQQVVRSHSHSQSQSSPGVSTPATQHVLVTYSQSGAPLKQVVVTQPPPVYVAKGQSMATYQASTSAPTAVLTHASPSVNAQYGSTLVQAQRQISQEQGLVTAIAKKPAVQSSSGDADVIITGVESTNRVNQGQSVGYRAAVTPSGEKVVILNASSGEGAIPYQTTALSTAVTHGAVRKVMAKTVDVSGQVVPSGPTVVPSSSLPTVSGQSQFVSAAAVGSQQLPPASVVPVVLAPATNTAQLPMSTIASAPQVVYRVATDPQVVQTHPQVVAGGMQVARGAAARDPSVRTIVPVNNNSPANMRAAQVVANSQPATPVIVAFSGVSTTKPYAIVNAMPGTQIPAAASLPHPPKTYSLVSEKQTNSSSTNKLQNREVVQNISKKIGDAFDSGNEQLLLATFEDAWKKFQANGKEYESSGQVVSSSTKVVGKDPPPPNAEVFAVPGTTSRVSLVRQTSSNRTVLAPKTSSPIPAQQVIAPPPLSSKEQTNYVYTAAPGNAGQSQVYLQPVTTSPQQQKQQQTPSHSKVPSSHSKVHSSGLFYPPSSTESVAVLQKKAAPGTGNNIQQRVVVSQSSSAAHHSGSSNATLRETNESQTTVHRRRSSKSKHCARCGKSATYLCSGCHTEWYCGRECQLKAWDTHAEHCKA